MNERFEEILDQCIQQIRAGKSVEDCLAGYSPEMAAELRPLLVVASQVIRQPVPQPCAAAYDQGRQKMLAKLAEKQASAPVSLSLLARYTQRIRTFFDEKEYQDMRFITRFAIASLIVAMVGGLFATVSVSASSLPGDSLYPIKRNLEEVRLLLEPNPTAKEQFQQQLQSTRVQEIEELHRKGRVATIDFEGVIQAISGDTWTINGLTLKVDQNTEQVGDCVVGAVVRVTVQVQSDGSLLLLKAVALPKKPLPTPLETARATRTPFPTPNDATRTALPTRPEEHRPTPTGPTPNSETPTRPPEHGPTPNSATKTALPPRPTEPGKPTLIVPTFPYPGPGTPTYRPTLNGATKTAQPTKPSTPNGETRTAQPTKPPSYWPTPTHPSYPAPATPTKVSIPTYPSYPPPATPTKISFPTHPVPTIPGKPAPTRVYPTYAPTATPISPYPAPR